MLQPSLAAEKIKVKPIFKSSKVPSGKNFNYIEGKPELKLKTFKSKIPVGLKTPSHTYHSPILICVIRGRLKHVRG